MRKILGILIVGVILRIIFVFIYPQPVTKDAADYDRIAWNIVNTGQMYPNPNADNKEILGRVPVYPIFLSIIYKLGGHSYVLVRLIQALLDIIMCFLLFLIARNLGWAEKPSLFALGIVLLNPFTSAYVSAVIAESLGIFILAAAFYMLYVSFNKNTVWTYILAGLIFGALTLCRPQYILLTSIYFLLQAFIWLKSYKKYFWVNSVLILLVLSFPFLSLFNLLPGIFNYFANIFFFLLSPILLLAWFIIPRDSLTGNLTVNNINQNIISQRVKGIMIMTLVSILTVLPWTYRNYLMTNKFIPLIVPVSESKWHYMNTLPIPFGKDPAEVDEKWNRFLKSQGEEREKLGKELDEIGYQRFKNKPYSYVWLTLRRAVRLWNQGNLLYSYQEPRWVWGIFTGLAFIYYLLAIFGAWITRKHWWNLYPLYVPFVYLTILTAPSHVESRYFIGVFPIVCLLGGMGLYYLWARWKKGSFPGPEPGTE